METAEQFFDGSGQPWDAAQGPVQPTNVHIDPLLDSITDTSTAMTTSPMFDSNPMQATETSRSSIQGMSLPGVMPADAAGSHGTRSSGTASVHSDVFIPPIESRRSSVTSPPSAATKNDYSLRSFQQQIKPPKPLRRSHTSPTVTSSLQQPTVASQPRSSKNDDDQHGEKKRESFLLRNRLAASRCRQKKKQWVHQLEETKDELEHQNNCLQMERKTLIDDVGRMKHYLMAHASCNHPIIDTWIKDEAMRAIERSKQRFANYAYQQGLCSHEHHQEPEKTPSGSNSTESPSIGINRDRVPNEMLDPTS